MKVLKAAVRASGKACHIAISPVADRLMARKQRAANLPSWQYAVQGTAMYKPTDSAAMRHALFFIVAIAFCSRPVDAQATSENTVKVSVGTGRPVAKAVEELVFRYGYVITYEDPRLTYKGDLRYLPTHGVVVPQGGTLDLTLPSSHSISAETIASLLQQVMQAQTNTQQGGRFRVERDGALFHVLPTAARDQNGNWSAQTPLLDVPISLPLQDRDHAGTLYAVGKAIKAASGMSVDIPTFGGIDGPDPDHPRQYRLGAENERARDVLMRALTLVGTPPTRVTWLMFCEKLACAINIEAVPDSAHLEETAP
jgi:hypothetical protein